jgi:hypothetical protein
MREPSEAINASVAPATTSSHPPARSASMSVSRPAVIRRPFARIATRLHSASASLSTCELKNTVHPASRRRRISARTSRRPSGSSPDIGSSKITSSGSLISAWAMPTRCSIPFENFPQLKTPFPADPDFVEQAAGAGAPFGRAADAEEARVIDQQFFGGEVVVEVGILRQVADAALDRQIAERPAEDLGAAPGREHQLHQQLQRRRLAGAVGSEETEHLAGFHVQRQPIERAIRTLAPETYAVVLRQVVCGKGAHVISNWRAAARWRSPDRSTAAAARPRLSRR